ncbi:ubiquitin thioesterase otubain-like protein, partial [Genlisea aurea]
LISGIRMENKDGPAAAEFETSTKRTAECSEVDSWENFKDDDIMQQTYDIKAHEAAKIPFVGDKEPLSSLEAEYTSGNIVFVKKIKALGETYGSIRRARGDGNCFFRSFMFAYFEHILKTKERAEVDRIRVNVEQCRRTLLDLGYAELTFEDFFELFLEQLEIVLVSGDDSKSHEELVMRTRDPSTSDYVVMFFRFITSGEIRKKSEFYEPFIQGLSNSSVDQFCKASVEPMGEESDHIHITALSEALGVPIRVVYLDRSCDDKGNVTVNHHDFVPASRAAGTSTTAAAAAASSEPLVTLLYRPGHYDVLYP